MNYLGLIIGLLSFVMFFRRLGKEISIRNIFAVLMCLQFLVSPFLVYNGFEDYQFYQMKVTEQEYFSYVTPAMICFLVGLYFGWKRKDFEYRNAENLKLWYEKNSTVPYVFVAIGFVCSFLQPFVGGELTFIVYLIGGLKFVGLLLMILGAVKIPVKIMVVIITSIVISSFANIMFHDLFIWSIFLLATMAFRLKFSVKAKALALTVVIGSAIFIQSIKQDLRVRVWEQGEDLSLDLVEGTFMQVSQDKGGLLSKQNLAPHITRVNQGWIVASIMDNVPRNVPYAKGETIYKYVEAALLPRFIAPDKLNAGDKEIFNKYSGHTVVGSTSMALSSVGDAYINYGTEGGCVFMFVYGLLFNFVIRYFVRLSRSYPTAYVFGFLVLFYVIRPDCELQTTLGHLAKSGILLLILFRAFGRYFRIRSLEEEKQ